MIYPLPFSDNCIFQEFVLLNCENPLSHPPSQGNFYSSQSSASCTMELQGFTIPRKKRVLDGNAVSRPAVEREAVANGAAVLNPASERQRREVEEIVMCNLSDRKLRDFLSIENVKIISNSFLEKRFQKFHSSMKRSQSDKITYAFLLVGFDEASISSIVKNGLPVGSSFHGDLGNRMQGVYLYNHPDLVTPSYSFKNVTQRIMCFKVLRGHSLMVGLDSDNLDASLNGSSHSAASDFGVQSRLLKFRNNAVFLYEFDEASQPVKYPSNVVPFAVVDLVHGTKVHYGKLPTYASFLKIGGQKSELCSVVPRTGLFSGAECTFSSVIETDLLLPPLDIAECLHFGSNAYSWTSILDLLPVRQLIEPRHWGRLVTEQEVFIEINSKIKFFMTHNIFHSKHESYSRMVKGLRDKKMYLMGVSNDATIVLIPDGELTSFLGFPWTEYNHLNALLFSSRHSCLGITDMDRRNRELERDKDETLMKDRDNSLVADPRARSIMEDHFKKMKRYDHTGQKHLGTSVHVRKPSLVPRKTDVNSNSSARQLSNENSPDADYLNYKFEFVSAPVASKKSCVTKKLTNNGNRGMPIGKIPNKLVKFGQKRIRWTDQLNRPLAKYKIIEARGEHNAHSQQLHDMEHDEGKVLRQGKPLKVKPPLPMVSPSPPNSSTSSPRSYDVRPNEKNNMFRNAMSVVSKPITDETAYLPAFELPNQHRSDNLALMAPVKKEAERSAQKSHYANPPPPPPPRPIGRPITNGAPILLTPPALLQKLPNNRSQRPYSPSDALLNNEQNESTTECDMDIDSETSSVVEMDQDEQSKEEEFYDPHDIDYDMKIGPAEVPSTSNNNARNSNDSEQTKKQEDGSEDVEFRKNNDWTNVSGDNDEDVSSNEEVPKEPFNVLDLVLKQLGVSDIQRIVTSAKKTADGGERTSEDTDLRNIQEAKPEPIAIPLSPVSRDQIAPPASPTPAIEDVDLRILQPPVHVAFSLKKEVPKSSVVTSVFGEEDEDESEKSKENGKSNCDNTNPTKEDRDERAKDSSSKKEGGERITDYEKDRDRDRNRRDRDDPHHSRSGDRDRYKSRDSRERTRERSRERERSSDRHRKDRYDDRDRRERRDYDDRRHRRSSSRKDHSRTPPKPPPLVQQSLAAEETMDIPLPVAPPSAKPIETAPSGTTSLALPTSAANVPPPQLKTIGPAPSAAMTPKARQAADRLQTLMREKQKKNNTMDVPPPVGLDPGFVQPTYTAPFNCSINQAAQSPWQQPSAVFPGINLLKNIPPENSLLSALGIQPELISRLRSSVAAAKQASPQSKPQPVVTPLEELPPPESPPPAASPEPEAIYPQAIPVLGSSRSAMMNIPLSCAKDVDFRIQNQHQETIPDTPASPPSSSSVVECSPTKKKTFPKKIDHDRLKKDEDKDVMKGWGAALSSKKKEAKDRSIDSSDEEGQLSSDEDVGINSQSRTPGTEEPEEKKIESRRTSQPTPVPAPQQRPSSFLNHPPPFTIPPNQAAYFPPRQPLGNNSIQPLMSAAPIQMGNGHFLNPTNGPRFAQSHRETPTGYGNNIPQHQPKRMIVVVPDSLSFKTQMRPEDLENLLIKMQSTVNAKSLFLYHNSIHAEFKRQLEDPGCNQETKKTAHKYLNVINNFTRAQVASQMIEHDCDLKPTRNHLEILGCLKNVLTNVTRRNPDFKVEMVYMTHVSPATQLGRNLQDLGIRVLRPTNLTSQYPNLG